MAQFLVTCRSVDVATIDNFKQAVSAAEELAVACPEKEFVIFKAIAVSKKADAITTMLDSRRDFRDSVMCNCDGCAD